MKIELKDVLENMSNEQLVDVVRDIKIILAKNYKEMCVYEPTSNPFIDDAHYQEVSKLKDLLDRFKLV